MAKVIDSMLYELWFSEWRDGLFELLEEIQEGFSD